MKIVILSGVMAAAVCIAITSVPLMTPTAAAQEGKQIRIRMADRAITARLNDSEAARVFASMLPLTIQMDDHLRREKTGIIPRPLSERTPGSRTYELGDLGYWRPRNTFVIFYRQDGLAIPGPGIVLLGKVDAGVEIFDVPGTVQVAVESID
jgi:hypothetical protein